MDEDGGPTFVQIAAQLENAILDGSLAEQSQAPSANEPDGSPPDWGRT